MAIEVIIKLVNLLFTFSSSHDIYKIIGEFCLEF